MATNVAARGLDIPEVDLVIQSSPPQVRNEILFREYKKSCINYHFIYLQYIAWDMQNMVSVVLSHGFFLLMQC